MFSALAPEASASRQGVSYGNIKVPDERVDALSDIFHPKKVVYAEITFVDVGGVGRGDAGAFSPEVIQHMRNVDVLAHVVRVFDNPMVAQGKDPARDEGLFNDEILLLDQAVMERRAERMRKENKKGIERDATEACLAHLEDGEPVRTLELTDDQWETLNDVQLLSRKPLITLYNLGESEWEDATHASLRETRERGRNAISMAMCGSIEAEIATLDAEDQAEFLEGLGLGEPARDVFVKTAYRLLDLISFLTAGEDECRAWPIRRGLTARKAAGKVHSDIERGFIRAEIYQLADMLEAGSEAKLKATGKMGLEGKDYVMRDGDVVNYRFNV